MKHELRIMNLKTRGAGRIFAGGQAKRQSGFDDLADASLSVFKKILLGTLALLLLYTAPPAQAQGFSAGINPSVIQIQARPGARVEAPFTLENGSSEPITYVIFLKPFGPGAEKNGEPGYENIPSNLYADFLPRVQVRDGGTDISQLTLLPKQKKDLKLSINLTDEESGDKYFTVFFVDESGLNPTKNSFLRIKGGIGMNVLLSITPRSDSKAGVTAFSIPKLVTHSPVDFDLELENENDYYITPAGRILVKNMLGRVAGEIKIEPTNILANSSRINKLWWNKNLIPGMYKADLTLQMSDKGPVVKESRYFFAFPLKPTFVFLIIVLILFALIKSVRRKREYNL